MRYLLWGFEENWPCYDGTELYFLHQPLNSLTTRRFEQNFRWVIFKLISVTDGWDISCKIALRWMPLDLTDDKSTLVQVMAWCRQATSHYLNQCWPRFMSPYGVIRPQWVKRTGLAFVITVSADVPPPSPNSTRPSTILAKSSWNNSMAWYKSDVTPVP